MLEGILESAARVSSSATHMTDTLHRVVVDAHINLSLVLQQMNVEPEKQKESVRHFFLLLSLCLPLTRHLDWSVKWLRKNKNQVPYLEQYVRRKNQPPHPVFVALGASWFDDLYDAETNFTTKEGDRQRRSCRNCGLHEPQVVLSRCASCRFWFFW